MRLMRPRFWRAHICQSRIDAAQGRFERDAASRQVSISAQSSVESSRMEPRRC